MVETAIEVYVKEELAEIEDDLDLQALRLETDENKLLAVKLGMKELALEDERIYQIAKHEKMLGIKRLTEHEYNVWRWWLPTMYSTAKRALPIRSINSYSYDRIPGRVRRLMLHFKNEQPVFDELMIWTPERQVIDPALFGCITVSAAKPVGVWLLARWGESAESLISFEEIEKQKIEADSDWANSRRNLARLQQYALTQTGGVSTSGMWLQR